MKGVDSIMSHFARFGMEVHSGKIEPREDSKSVILFVSKPPSMYKDSTITTMLISLMLLLVKTVTSDSRQFYLPL